MRQCSTNAKVEQRNENLSSNHQLQDIIIVEMGEIDTSNGLNFSDSFVAIVHFNGAMTQYAKKKVSTFILPILKYLGSLMIVGY